MLHLSQVPTPLHSDEEKQTALLEDDDKRIARGEMKSVKTDDNFNIHHGCTGCGYLWPNKSDFVSHFEEDHLPKINTWPYECDIIICQKKKHNLLVDVITHHYQNHYEMSFKCLRCLEKFTSRDEAYDHVCIMRCYSCKKLMRVCTCIDHVDNLFEEETLEEILENLRSRPYSRFFWD